MTQKHIVLKKKQKISINDAVSARSCAHRYFCFPRNFYQVLYFLDDWAHTV